MGTIKKIMTAALTFDMYFWLFFILIIVIVGITIYFYNIYTHLSEFPTSPFVPVLGHILDYVDPCTTINILTNNVVKYGGTIRQFVGPRKPSLVTANNEFLEFLCNNSKYLSKAKFYRYMKPWLGEGLITSDGKKWLSRRKALSASLTQTSVLKSFVEIFESKGDILIDLLDKLQNEHINLHPIMKRFTIDVICETAMGVSLDSQLDSIDSGYAKNIENICEVILARMTSFFKNFDFFFKFTNDCVKEKESLAVIDDMLEKIIAKKMEERNRRAKTKKDMLDLLMEMEIDGKALSGADLREEINTLTFAGYDTSSSAMSLTLYEIAKNPEIQDKLLKEQRHIFKEDDYDDPLVTYEKLHEMIYLEMVIKETLRIHTIVPSIGRRVNKDLKYGNIKIPSMLNINILIHGFHHHPDYFPNPDNFNPERFSTDNNVDKFTYIPFGVKPRQCLGKNFAMLEMKSTLSKILRNFEIIQLPQYELKLQPKLVVFSANGIWVTVKRRCKCPTSKEKLCST